MTATGKTVELSGNDTSVTLPESKDTFSFQVPNESPVESERGKKSDHEFTYAQVSNDDEAQAVCKIKEWSLVEFVNDALRSQARANAYQSLVAAHKPSKVSADEIKERMIRDYIRLGIPADTARAQVESMLAAQVSN